jgi:hypothetical protein
MWRHYVLSALIFIVALELGILSNLWIEKLILPVQESPELLSDSVPEVFVVDNRLAGEETHLLIEYDCTPDIDTPPIYAVFRVTNTGSSTVYFDLDKIGQIDMALSNAYPWHKEVKAVINKPRLLPGDSTGLWVPVPKSVKNIPFDFSFKYRVIGQSWMQRFANESMGTQRDYQGCPSKDLRTLVQ